ncbi:MAG: hypothetical protein ABI184_05665 [Ginsengibacter sp.]
MKLFTTSVCICFLCLAQAAFAQSPKINTSIDKENILIGQQLHFRVQTSMPDNTYRLNWFTIPDSIGNFTVVKRNKIDSTRSNGNLNFSQDIVLTSFDSGRQVIPQIPLAVSTLYSDSSFSIYTDSAAVNVTYAPTDSIMPFHDIKPIIDVKSSFPWWAWVLVALAILILLAWIFFLRKFLGKKKDTVIFESKLSPYDEAMESLSSLEKEELVKNDEIKEYHLRLTEIFKRYLSRKSNTYQMHLTTDELLIELNELDLSKEQIATFANCLRMGNAVKFAQYVPPVYENEKCFSETKQMITSINNIVNKKPEDDI